ncbi:hypothetical protein I302_101001 [Kwoniella bestiolae CBS 10118]|uniref:Uncharacterized protein n=1 Tax=Kwoniella bestiolae CBS 10118 TaxID=1296100 RepID=A0A1B9G6S2_9TREE|nr:hypothetical protein I302_04378 [Kwoniella bestiolae CBS 10118]OCF26691.1 hypothetical protein I302_04378 [Kwoniella bestiolae CBS 10118]
MTTLAPYQRHLLQFAQNASSKNVTVLSALRQLLNLGLNFPLSFAIAIGLKIICNPFPQYFRSVHVPSLQPTAIRTQLEHVKIDQPSYSLSGVISLYSNDQSHRSQGLTARAIDFGHVVSFWCMAADQKTGLVEAEDVKRFQTGDWTRPVEQRRRSRLPGKGDVVPFWRGGPILVAPHSWFVKKLFGVSVYEPK